MTAAPAHRQDIARQAPAVASHQTPETEALLDLVRHSVSAYCAATHDFSFDPSRPVVRLHEPTMSGDEINAALECLLRTEFTMGRHVKGFEKAFAAHHGFAHGVMSNSGSSANLLALAALANPDTADGLKPGDEVIVPALSWSTTVWPVIQHGLVPVIVDIDPATWNIDPAEIVRAIGPRTRAVMIVPVYGNPCDMDAIVSVCREHGLILIEDCCEALGATYRGHPVGKFGRCGTFSFYYSHHMSTIEGGITVTDDMSLAELMRIQRAHGWVREVDDRQAWFDRYPSFDRRFLFVNTGYNLRPMELSGAMGSVQLPKLAGYVATRRRNASFFRAALGELSDHLAFQDETPEGESSWFGFGVKLRPSAPFTVAEITGALNAAGIETRPIICGNIARQPALGLYPHRTVGDLGHADAVMARAFSFGNHQAICDRARRYVVDRIADFLKTYG